MINKCIFPAIAGASLGLAVLACNFGAVPQTPVESTRPTTLPTSDSNNPAVVGACANPLLPVTIGTTWNYSLMGPISDTFTRTILSMDDSGFTDQDTFGTGAVRKGTWNCDHGNLIALDPNNGPSAFVNTTRSESDFHTTENSGVTLPAAIHTGDTWTQTMTIEGTQTINGNEATSKNNTSATCTAVGAETVTVLAGTFDATRLDCHMTINITVTTLGGTVPTHFDTTTTSWYAPNIGWVKSVTTTSDGTSIVELVSYTIP